MAAPSDSLDLPDPAPRRVADDKPVKRSELPGGEEEGDQLREYLADIVSHLFFPLYDQLVHDTALEEQVDRALEEANIRRPPDTHLTLSMATGAIIGGLLGLLVTAPLYFTLVPVKPIFDALGFLPVGEEILAFISRTIWGLLGGIVTAFGIVMVGGFSGALAGVSVGAAYPKMIASRRRKEIDLLLPDTVDLMYALSVGGMNQLDIFEAVAKAESVYGEASVEFQRIVRNTEYFGMNYQEAIRDVANTTPSDDLNRFLIDALSIINEGGRIDTFLKKEKEAFLSDMEREQRKQMDNLEFLGQMYLSFSLLPMIFLIILVVMTLMSGPQILFFYLTVYLGIPAMNIVFLVLVAMFKVDDLGGATLEYDDGTESSTGRANENFLFSFPVIDNHFGDGGSLSEKIRRGEATHRLLNFLTDPLDYFRIHPMRTFWVTVPLALLVVGFKVFTGDIRFSFAATIQNPYHQTVWLFYIPTFITLIPFALFQYWKNRSRGKITDHLTEMLRKLAKNNETGQPFLESVRSTGRDAEHLLAREFTAMYNKVRYGGSLNRALVDFNNKYRIPRLARTVNLIRKAQEASDNITPVLETAASASEVHDDVEKDRRSRTRMQVAIVGVTYIIFLIVLIVIKLLFIDTMGGLVSGDGGVGGGQGFSVAALNETFLGAMYFHAITIQGALAGVSASFMHTGDLRSSPKYIVLFLSISLVVWGVVL